MPQLLDLPDELILQVIAFNPYQPFQESHRSLYVTNKRFNGVMHDKKLPEMIAERQYFILHDLERSQLERHIASTRPVREGRRLPEIDLSSLGAYLEHLWYEQSQVEEWKCIFPYSDRRNIALNTAAIISLKTIKLRFRLPTYHYPSDILR